MEWKLLPLLLLSSCAFQFVAGMQKSGHGGPRKGAGPKTNAQRHGRPKQKGTITQFFGGGDDSGANANGSQ